MKKSPKNAAISSNINWIHKMNLKPKTLMLSKKVCKKCYKDFNWEWCKIDTLDYLLNFVHCPCSIRDLDTFTKIPIECPYQLEQTLAQPPLLIRYLLQCFWPIVIVTVICFFYQRIIRKNPKEEVKYYRERRLKVFMKYGKPKC